MKYDMSIRNLPDLSKQEKDAFRNSQLKELSQLRDKTPREVWLCTDTSFKIIAKAMLDRHWCFKGCQPLTMQSFLLDDIAELKHIDGETRNALDNHAASLMLLRMLKATDIRLKVREIGMARSIYLKDALERLGFSLLA